MANSKFLQPLAPSAALAAVIGRKRVARTEAVKKIWEYIKDKGLQNPENRRNILADEKLERLFGKKEVTMFELAKIVSENLKVPPARAACKRTCAAKAEA